MTRQTKNMMIAPAITSGYHCHDDEKHKGTDVESPSISPTAGLFSDTITFSSQQSIAYVCSLAGYNYSQESAVSTKDGGPSQTVVTLRVSIWILITKIGFGSSIYCMGTRRDVISDFSDLLVGCTRTVRRIPWNQPLTLKPHTLP